VCAFVCAFVCLCGCEYVCRGRATEDARTTIGNAGLHHWTMGNAISAEDGGRGWQTMLAHNPRSSMYVWLANLTFGTPNRNDVQTDNSSEIHNQSKINPRSPPPHQFADNACLDEGGGGCGGRGRSPLPPHHDLGVITACLANRTISVRLYDWRAERLTISMGNLLADRIVDSWQHVQSVHGVMDSWRRGGIC